MLTYLNNVKWIGDLSLEDADVLARYARQSSAVLEFGAGGSTQIICQCSSSVVSVETDPDWIERTQQHILKLEYAAPVEFVPYTTQFDKKFDLIFVDGIYTHRQPFAMATWQNLNVGGVMIFHDTRRWWDFEFAAEVAKRNFNEISQIDVNAAASNGLSSNMTVLHKKAAEPYVDWNKVEAKPAWAYGMPDGEEHDLWAYK